MNLRALILNSNLLSPVRITSHSYLKYTEVQN